MVFYEHASRLPELRQGSELVSVSAYRAVGRGFASDTRTTSIFFLW